ncbi:hypothetical protein HCA89_07640 [Listeria innocua]|uniref:YpoC-like domain-containing protein n=1 Tax=Listeria innocua TaxID=1642 RepID=A0AB73H9A1_LISIO|nr:hypothetical protein [Listeria innocua]MBC2142181.1 hypothetical protein [Listeria innocua]MBC2151150.1 hypothetical protein [Listeria innocua]
MAEFKYAVELIHPDFPAPDVIAEEYDPESIYVSGLPFWQEQQFFTKGEGVIPWKNETDRACRKLAKHMTNLAESMEADLKVHQKPSPVIVRDALGIFLSILFWSNHRPVQLDNLTEQIKTLETKPLNLEERLEYVLKRGNTFLGFRQLNELVLEQRKLIAKR